MSHNSSPLSGFLNIHKPQGPTSFQIIKQLRNITNIKKIGHCGTLDPMASGVMICAIGQATKLIEYLVKANKTYIAEITFGATSDTYDAKGIITQSPQTLPAISQSTIEQLINQHFSGTINQIPPKYSALKINGQRAYKLARQGEEFQMKQREVTIHQTNILQFQWPKITLEINCSSGTYIRSIAHDLGQYLETGGYLSQLTRTHIEDFTLDQSLKLNEKTSLSEVQNKLLPLSVATNNLPQIQITNTEAESLQKGQFIPNRINTTGLVAAFYNDKLFAIVTPHKSGQIKVHKLIN